MKYLDASDRLNKLYFKGESDKYNASIDEEIENPIAYKMPESAWHCRKSKEELLNDFLKYDVVSFDIFDTLILRKVSSPRDVFSIMEQKMKETFFKDMRIRAEEKAREKYAHSDKEMKSGIYGKNLEVSIDDIYDTLKSFINIDKKKTMDLEFEIEKQVCFANPYMQYIFNKLIENGKEVIIVSDMYWTKSYLEKLLANCGYKGYKKLYVSCEYLCNKGTGLLQEIAGNDLKGKTIIHVGDNYYSDVLGSRKNNWHAYHYIKSGDLGKGLRPDLSKTIANSLYKGLVDNYLHCDEMIYSKEYEHGFKCAGPIVYGFNKWLHDYCIKYKIDKIMFLARDMDVFYKAYKIMYPNEKCTYTATSRLSAWILCFEDYPEPFIRFFFLNRANLGKQTIEDALLETDMGFLVSELESTNMNYSDTLTINNYPEFHDFLMIHKKEILDHFKPSIEAGKKYLKQEIGDAKKVVAVDLGWRGSIVMMMESIFGRMFGKDVEIKGAFLGLTNNESSNNCIEREFFDSYLFSGFKNIASTFSTSTLEGDMCAKFFEATFTSNEGTLLKYTLEKDGKVGFERGIVNNIHDKVDETQKGVIDFVIKYEDYIKDYQDIAKLGELDVLKIGITYLSNFEYANKLFKDTKEWEFALPNYRGEGTLTTLGEMLVGRKLI